MLGPIGYPIVLLNRLQNEVEELRIERQELSEEKVELQGGGRHRADGRIRHVGTDYLVSLATVGVLHKKMASRKVGARKKPPADLVIEAKIAQRVVSDLESV